MVYTCSGEVDFVTLVFCLTVYFVGHVFLAGRSVKIRAFDGLAGTCNPLQPTLLFQRRQAPRSGAVVRAGNEAA